MNRLRRVLGVATVAAGFAFSASGHLPSGCWYNGPVDPYSSALRFKIPMLAYIVSVVNVRSLQNRYSPKVSLHEIAQKALFRLRLNTKAPLSLYSSFSHILSSQDRQTGLTYRTPTISMVYAHIRSIFPYVVCHYGLRGARASKNLAIRQ